MICATCGHEEKFHRRERHNGVDKHPCVYFGKGFTPCYCKDFKSTAALQPENLTQGETQMAEKKAKVAKGKKEKKAKVAKGKKEKKAKVAKGRKPTLAPFVDAPFKIYAKTGGKEYEAQVLSSGVIKYEDKEFTSPSSVACFIKGKNSNGKQLMVDGWNFWKYNKDGECVPLNVLRGKESPLAEPKAKTPRKKKAAAAAA